MSSRNQAAKVLRQALNASLEKLASGNLQPVTVAVVDSGVDARHLQLRGRVISAVRVEANGRKQRFTKTPAKTNADVYGHGTAVASIIAKIAPNAQIVDVRVLDAHNACTGDTLIAGFRHAIESRARIINMSLAANAKFASSLRDLCEVAYRQNQIVVAARRNMPLTDQGFPAEAALCIGVEMAKLPSQFQLLFLGDRIIEFAARGEQVVVAAAGGGETTMTGTSFATPAVSGLCALLTGAYPELRPFEVKTLLRALSN
jgi:subtilisin family serine protease